MVLDSGDGVSVSGEEVIIVWDEKTNTQHFIRRASFQTKAADFGFLVPTPTEPELAEADSNAFLRMNKAIEPKIAYSYRYEFEWTLWGVANPTVEGIFANADLALSDVDVEVLQETCVAGYNASVLRANDAAALLDWLARNGYEFKPEISEWLNPYVEAGWIITAFKYAQQADASSKTRSGHSLMETGALRMSFRTDRPFYPYREPLEQGKKAKGGRSLRVFFVSGSRIQGHLGGDGLAWPGRVVYADKRTDVATLLTGVLPVAPSAESLWLTAFVDSSRVRPDGEDVYFKSTGETTSVVPPPTHVLAGVRRVPLCLDALLIIGLCMVALRSARSRSRAQSESAAPA